ncbi:hypothetical protein [Desulfovibrio sp. ZJ369]|uniref:hypothetical protein n=1 Tax=Desulfovibrio sp. ZJ369 TaxID=2709793 RepID=UPI0013EB7C82|nr:hypothetical protein [Desulfovibrio sp. ZJ369]
MNTYYIPTSTLNFNNIFSTESISPKSFYEKRGFGYRRWESVEENKFDDSIVLYKSPHKFERPKSDVEDRPMLIEIRTDESFAEIQEGVYTSERTIYLDKWHTRIIFFSDEDKRIALINSESSGETKMIRLYKEQIIVEDNYEGTFPVIGEGFIPSSPQKEELINKDRKINKLKGLLYGYYIGAFLSSSSDKVEKLSILRDINNIFHSIISNPSGMPSEMQCKRLADLFDKLQSHTPLFKDFNKEFEREDAATRILEISRQNGADLRTFLREHGILPPSLSVLLRHLQEMPEGKQVAKRDNEDSVNPAIEWINKEMSKAQSEIKNSHQPLSVDNEIEIIVSANGLSSIDYIKDALLKDLYTSWVNDIFCSSKYDGKVGTFKIDLAKEITYKAKDICSDKWENSHIRTYLNQLIQHLAGKEFTQSWDNGLLSSIAAVLIKGDNWETLLQFMQSKGMYEYRLAFSIYGALNGFANLTRDFTDNLITLESKYVSEIYREFYGEIFQKPLIPTKNEGSAARETIRTSEEEADQNCTHDYGVQSVNNDGEDMQTPAGEEHIPQGYLPIKKDSASDVKKDEWEELCKQMLSFFDENDHDSSKDKKLRRASLIEAQRQCPNNIQAMFNALREKDEWKTPKTHKPKKIFTQMRETFLPSEQGTFF